MIKAKSFIYILVELNFVKGGDTFSFLTKHWNVYMIMPNLSWQTCLQVSCGLKKPGQVLTGLDMVRYCLFVLSQDISVALTESFM